MHVFDPNKPVSGVTFVVGLLSMRANKCLQAGTRGGRGGGGGGRVCAGGGSRLTVCTGMRCTLVECTYVRLLGFSRLKACAKATA